MTSIINRTIIQFKSKQHLYFTIGEHSSFEIQVSKINLSFLHCEIEALTLLIEEVSNRFPWLDGGGFLLPNLRDLHSSPNTSKVS